jgi:hypothetical protein
MNKECTNYINKATDSNEKSPCGPGPTGQCVVQAAMMSIEAIVNQD